MPLLPRHIIGLSALAIGTASAALAQSQPTEAIAGTWRSDAQFIVKSATPDLRYFWVGPITVSVSPTGRTSGRANNGCAMVGLLMPSRPGRFDGSANLTGCRHAALNRTYNIDGLAMRGGGLKLTVKTSEVSGGRVQALYEISSSLVKD